MTDRDDLADRAARFLAGAIGDDWDADHPPPAAEAEAWRRDFKGRLTGVVVDGSHLATTSLTHACTQAWQSEA